MNSLHSLKLCTLLSLLLFSCSSPRLYPQGSLGDQILVARHHHEGKLTNRVCTKYKGETCIEDSVIEYDLSSSVFREEARKLNFVCKVGGRQYKICPDQPGFCRTTYQKNWFQKIVGGGKKNVEYLSGSPTQTLIDLHIRCFSETQYDWDSI